MPQETDTSEIFSVTYLDSLRTQMLKFAENQLSDAQLAEDAVQEAMMGAMKNVDSFNGRSAYKTWVFAILKYKIADIRRKRHRSMEINNIGSDDDDNLPNLFDLKGAWHDDLAPNEWADPENAFKQDQFWEVLEICLGDMPERQAKIFMLREYIGLSSDEICAQESMSTSNLHVTLYRARLRLQKCLEIRWFGEGVQHA